MYGSSARHKKVVRSSGGQCHFQSRRRNPKLPPRNGTHTKPCQFASILPAPSRAPAVLKVLLTTSSRSRKQKPSWRSELLTFVSGLKLSQADASPEPPDHSPAPPSPPPPSPRLTVTVDSNDVNTLSDRPKSAEC